MFGAGSRAKFGIWDLPRPWLWQAPDWHRDSSWPMPWELLGLDWNRNCLRARPYPKHPWAALGPCVCIIMCAFWGQQRSHLYAGHPFYQSTGAFFIVSSCKSVPGCWIRRMLDPHFINQVSCVSLLFTQISCCSWSRGTPLYQIPALKYM